MPLINCKVELKHKWIKYSILSPADNDNNDANSNIIFTIKDTKLYVPTVTLSTKNDQNYQNPLAKDLKDWSIGMRKLL